MIENDIGIQGDVHCDVFTLEFRFVDEALFAPTFAKRILKDAKRGRFKFHSDSLQSTNFNYSFGMALITKREATFQLSI